MRLNLDPSDSLHPLANGMVDVPFTFYIPSSVAAANVASPFLQCLESCVCQLFYAINLPCLSILDGHGLFCDQSEVLSPFLVQEANRWGHVVAGVDWTGLSSADQIPVVQMLLDNLTKFVDCVCVGLNSSSARC